MSLQKLSQCLTSALALVLTDLLLHLFPITFNLKQSLNENKTQALGSYFSIPIVQLLYLMNIHRTFFLFVFKSVLKRLAELNCSIMHLYIILYLQGSSSLSLV